MPRSPEPDLWSVLPGIKLAPEGSPGLMGYLRSQVELPPDPPSFGQSSVSSLLYDIVDSLTGQTVDNTSTRESAQEVRTNLARHYGTRQSRYTVRQSVTWGVPMRRFYALVYTGGPYNGAFVKIDERESPILFQSPDDAYYHLRNYLPPDPQCIVVPL